jgi:hypothetical protein
MPTPRVKPKGLRMSGDPEERLRNLRDAIEDVIDILEGVKERG